MGFLPDLAKATTVQNNSVIQQPGMTSDQYLNFANQAGNNATQGQGQFNANLAGQQGLMQQYQGVANGTGPNPAQAMLAQQTGNNIAAQSALMAGQRGGSANAGLIARQGAMQGANTQQQAVGQGATLQAQQQLGALQGMGGLYGQMGNQITGQQNANSGLFNVAAGANSAQNAQNIGVQQSNAGIEQANAGTAQGALSGFASGSGAAMSSLSSGSGSQSKADGGMIEDEGSMMPQQEVGGPQSSAGSYLNSPDLGMSEEGEESPTSQLMPTQQQSAPLMNPQQGDVAPLAATAGTAKDGFFKQYGMSMMMARGGQVADKVPVMLSPGEKKLDPGQAKAVAKGKMNPMKGATVPGAAKVKGDSLKNDTVSDEMEPGSVVIPRHIM